MLGQLTGEDEAHGGLDLSGGQGGLVVVAGQLGRLGGNLLEHVVHERVHDRHGLFGDADVTVDLLQHLVDVGGVAFDALLAALLGTILEGGLLGRLLGGLFLGCVGDNTIRETRASWLRLVHAKSNVGLRD